MEELHKSLYNERGRNKKMAVKQAKSSKLQIYNWPFSNWAIVTASIH